MGRGLAVLAEDVEDVCVPAWVVVVVLFTVVVVGEPVAAVCLRERVLDPALCLVVAAVLWVSAVSCFREELVAPAVVPVVTCGPPSWLVEDTEGVVVFSTAPVAEVVVWPGLSAGAVSAPALSWPGAGVAWSCSVVCSVVLWLTGVV